MLTTPMEACLMCGRYAALVAELKAKAAAELEAARAKAKEEMRDFQDRLATFSMSWHCARLRLTQRRHPGPAHGQHAQGHLGRIQGPQA